MAARKKHVDLDEARCLASQGFTNREIAERLGVGVVTLWKKGFRRDDEKPVTDWDDIQRRLDDGEYFRDVAASMGLSPRGLRSRRAREGLPPLRVKSRHMERSPRWSGGRMVRKGYVLIKRPDHPNASARGYVFEHRLVVEEVIGRHLRPEEVVHHINGVKDDNRPENLELFASNGEHISKTRKGVRRTKGHAP